MTILLMLFQGRERDKVIKNEKGFSLVELIIVIAIMAVLVGVVGTQVIPYLNSARVAKDTQILTSYATAGVSAYTYNAESAQGLSSFTITVTAGATDDTYTPSAPQIAPIVTELEELINCPYVTDASHKFQSAKFKQTNSIVIEFDFTTREVQVYAIDGAGNTINDDTVMGVL